VGATDTGVEMVGAGGTIAIVGEAVAGDSVAGDSVAGDSGAGGDCEGDSVEVEVGRATS